MSSNDGDNNEIALDEDNHDLNEITKDIAEPSHGNSNDENCGTSEKDTLQQRLLRLKMKMNQSRTLNRKEMLHEAERFGNEEFKSNERKRLQIDEKKRRQREWEECHKNVLSTTSNMKEAKLLVQHASESTRNATKKEAKVKANRFDVDDYYNPEGQFRHYQRNLRSLSANNIHDSSVDTYDPLSYQEDETQEAKVKSGIKRLGDEMKRRAEKKLNKKSKLEFSGEDVSYVNKRNKRFNEKISRNFDKYTAEIRQNLERGTAL